MAPPGAWWPLWEQGNVSGVPSEGASHRNIEVPSGGVSRGHIVLPAAVFAEGERPHIRGPTQLTFIHAVQETWPYRPEALSLGTMPAIFKEGPVSQMAEFLPASWSAASLHTSGANTEAARTLKCQSTIHSAQFQGYAESGVPTKIPVRCLEWLFVTQNPSEGPSLSNSLVCP